MSTAPRGVAGAHNTVSAPALSGVLDLDGTEYDNLPDHHLGTTRRTFRASGVSAPMGARVALDDSPELRAVEHSTRGTRDTRRTEEEFSGHTSGTPGQYDAEQFDNAARPVALDPKAPPVRARAGWTGEDNTRAAVQRRPLLLRAFDQLIAHHPTGAAKVEMPSPVAAFAPDLDALPDALPGAFSASGTRREGIGAQPNTYRLLPRAWDTLAINTGEPEAGTAPAAPARGRGFRA